MTSTLSQAANGVNSVAERVKPEIVKVLHDHLDDIKGGVLEHSATTIKGGELVEAVERVRRDVNDLQARLAQLKSDLEQRANEIRS